MPLQGQATSPLQVDEFLNRVEGAHLHGRPRKLDGVRRGVHVAVGGPPQEQTLGFQWGLEHSQAAVEMGKDPIFKGQALPGGFVTLVSRSRAGGLCSWKSS